MTETETREALADLFEQPAETHCERCGKAKRADDNGETMTIWRRQPHAAAQRLTRWQCGACCYQAALMRTPFTWPKLERK